MGGGLVLLRAFLASSGHNARWLLIDERAKGKLGPNDESAVHYVRRSVFARLSAEWQLHRHVDANDVVLCFHGLPPLFPLPGQVVVFLQNRILVNNQALSDYPLHTRARLRFERLILRAFSRHVDRFIVQTPSMANDVERRLGTGAEIREIAFTAEMQTESRSLPETYDFVYVAGDEAHKNHAVLLDAWRLLARDGSEAIACAYLASGFALASTVAQSDETDCLTSRIWAYCPIRRCLVYMSPVLL